jgi:tetratricopeptide (TPR) repeat protein
MAAFLVAVWLISMPVSSQVQRGYVKTKGVLQEDGSVKAGVRIEGATIDIRSINSILSRQRGEFSFNIPGATFYLSGVRKQGYVLADPEATTRAYSHTATPLVVVLEDPQERIEAIKTAKAQIRRTMNAQLRAKEDEIKALKDKSEQEKEDLTNQLYEQHENAGQLIAAMAERYVSTDFDEVNELNRQIGALILAGELNKADSLIRSKGDFNSREKELQTMEEDQAAMERARDAADNAARRIAHERQLKMADLAQDYYNQYTIFATSFKNDSAAFYLERRAALDSTKVEWLIEAGRFYSNYLADYDKAMNLYGRALRIASAQYGEQCDLVAATQNDIGTVFERKGDVKTALEYYQKAIAVREHLNDTLQINTADIYNNIGHAYNALAKYDESLECYGKVLTIQEQLLTADHPDIGRTYLNMGTVYIGKGDYPQSMEYYQKAQAIWETSLGENDLNLAVLYNNMGHLCERQGNYAQALQFHQKALAVYQRVLGEEHPNTAMSYNNIASVYDSMGKYDQAMEYMQKGLAVSIAKLGPRHPQVAISYNNISQIYCKRGEYEKALGELQKALAIDLAVYGEQHPSTANVLNNIGSAYDDQGAYVKALEYHERALAIRKALLGEQHPDVATVLNNIAMVYLHQGNNQKALEYFVKALQIKEQALGENHPEVAVIYSNIGNYCCPIKIGVD